MVSSVNDQQQLLIQLLQREVSCARLLLQLLESEHEILARKDADALEEMAKVKQERIQQLELISTQREKQFASFAGVKINKNEQGAKYYQFDDNQQLSALWDELVDLAENCRDKNRINGGIVELASRQSRQALDILQGILPEASSVPELYDNKGQATKFSKKRILKHA